MLLGKSNLVSLRKERNNLVKAFDDVRDDLAPIFMFNCKCDVCSNNRTKERFSIYYHIIKDYRL